MSKLILTIIEFEMPYYHLRIKQKNRRGPIYLYDFERKRLEDFLVGARNNVESYLQGEWIEPQLITDIEIAETRKKSKHYGVGFMHACMHELLARIAVVGTH